MDQKFENTMGGPSLLKFKGAKGKKEPSQWLKGVITHIMLKFEGGTAIKPLVLLCTQASGKHSSSRTAPELSTASSHLTASSEFLENAAS